MSLPLPTAALVVLLVCFWGLLGSQVVDSARDHDFLNLYTGATLARQGQFSQLHDPAVQLAQERRLAPSTRVLVPFVRPHFWAAALAPLSMLPFRTAFVVWIATQCAILLACWCVVWKRFGADALVWGSLSLPAALGIVHGQDCTVMLAIMLTGWLLAESGRDRSAGAILALGLFKFHLVLLFPLAMVAAKRWRMLGGFALGTGILGAINWFLAGAGGLAAYAALLLDPRLPRLSPTPEFMINVQGLCANLGLGTGAKLLLSAMVVALALWAVRNAPLWLWFSITITAGLLVPPHVYGYDATMLLLTVWLAFFRSRILRTRIAAAIAGAPLAFMAALADKPWSALPSLVLLTLLLALAFEALTKPPAAVAAV